MAEENDNRDEDARNEETRDESTSRSEGSADDLAEVSEANRSSAAAREAAASGEDYDPREAADMSPEAAEYVGGQAPVQDIEPHVVGGMDQDLEHTRGGSTTRDDAADLGVPMIQGDGAEPVGPEDALGPGQKRGDYSERLGGSDYNPHEARINDEGAYEMVAQRPRVEEVGNSKANRDKKGGVDTA